MELNEVLYNKAEAAARALFDDKSVDASQTRSNLEALIDEINILIDTLPKEEYLTTTDP